ncbi:zinc ribbon domain-containing protein, partial [Nonomuraea sp. NPDC049750]|uniref:zinc ribbon domain-containing protein n=1 Tax=Nonomuraea sp. NPDC049750 TaxID=3154738 RepID=UPI003409C96A
QRIGVEHERLCARIRNLNKALAWSAARWAVDQTVAAGATVIYLEDLATLEARGRRGSANARLSGQVRGKIVEAIRHLAARHSIAVVTVPARGTSRYCPRCGAGTSVLTHGPAPDRLGERGWRWASCPACGLSCDRDWAAAERILARGLLGQTPPAPTAPPACAPSTPSWRATWPAPDHDANSPGRPGAPAAPEQTCIPDQQHATEPRGAPPRNGPPASRPTQATTHQTAHETTR